MAPVFVLDDTPGNMKAAALGMDDYDNYVLDTTANDLAYRGYKYGDISPHVHRLCHLWDEHMWDG